jgi:short-subunit dehydrogenase
MHVVIVSRSLEKLHAALAELKAAHPGVEVSPCSAGLLTLLSVCW